jgi:hypothetical protein
MCSDGISFLGVCIDGLVHAGTAEPQIAFPHEKHLISMGKGNAFYVPLGAIALLFQITSLEEIDEV